MKEVRPDPRIPSATGAAEPNRTIAPSGPPRSTVPAEPTVPEQPARPLPAATPVAASDGARADAERAALQHREQAEARTERPPEGTPPPADEVLEQTGTHPLGATIGAIGGAGMGAVIGIAAGPVGSLVGAVGGAVAGGLLGSGAAGDKPVVGPVTEASDEPEPSGGGNAARADARPPGKPPRR